MVSTDDHDLAAALAAVLPFLAAAPLTAAIADLEYALDGATADTVSVILKARGISADLLTGAEVIRSRLGRINDLIHASAIAVVLPHLLEPGEVLARPSLAAGNDPTRPFDVQTDRRVAEFKLARWDGHDAMRKRHLVKDLVHLAAAGTRAELYVVGARPLRFLKQTKASIAWALNRFPSTHQLYGERFGDSGAAVSAFAATHAAHVRVIDLAADFPGVFKP